MTRAASSRWGIRAVLTGALVAMMLVLIGAMLMIAFHQFDDLAARNARMGLTQQARAGADSVADLVQPAAALVDNLAGQRAARTVLDEAGRRSLQQRFAAELSARPGLASVQLVLATGEGLQLVALRESTLLPAGMLVPPAARFASRHTRVAADGRPAPAPWRFMDRDAVLLAERDGGDGGEPWAPAAAEAQMRPATNASGIAYSQPFLAAGTGAPMMTVSRRLADDKGVVSATVDLQDLSLAFTATPATPHAVTALFDQAGRIVAWGGGPEAARPAGLQLLADPALAAQRGDPVLASLPADAGDVWRTAGVTYTHADAELGLAPFGLRVAAYAPLADFGGVQGPAWRWMAACALFVLVAASILALFGARRIASSLDALADDARRIHNMDLAQTPRVRSQLREIDELGSAQAVMKASVRASTEALRTSQQKLEDLIAAGLNMSRERDMMGLLQRMLWGARQLTHCDAVTLYTVTDQRTLKFALRTREDNLPAREIPLHDPSGRENIQFVSAFVALRNQPVVIEDVYSETRFDLSGTRGFDATSGYRTVSMLALPLAPREGEVIGVLQLMNALDPVTGEVVPFNTEAIRLASALAAQAAVSLDNHQLVKAQQDVMDSMVRLIAGAIDAKSPYTGGHCERVPELAFMLAEEATAVTDGPLASFGFHTPEEWREFRVGAWLHDCGKMTTPEYVVDKATKLETIYDRIHEIRTRHEVLWRDAEIDYLKACAAGEDAAAAARRRDKRQATLVDDFAFIAECNLGAEYMAQERVTRLRQIGEQTWWRHFDDRLGISYGAQAQLIGQPSQPLPVLEKLLADKPEHIVPRPPSAAMDPRHGFKMDVPEHLYNFGELHNLSVSRGTLTPEERYKINEHIMQTIVMLDAMPFPKNLRRVPEYAGTHHETLTGKGYPRRLTADQLSVPARIMAVADIFEALTAADRPYKKSKTLSEAVEILFGFKQRGHIDGDVFDLFLTSGVYLRYAERFLAPELIDAVEIGQYLGPTTWTSRRHPPPREKV
jgi:HD-GYP domain-containing protein (c-di-GMP phosphodiesterase class II)/HAMP domain-containing protein